MAHGRMTTAIAKPLAEYRKRQEQRHQRAESIRLKADFAGFERSFPPLIAADRLSNYNTSGRPSWNH